MKKFLIIFLGLVLLGILGYICIYHFKHNESIQDDINTRTHAEFSTQDLKQVTINTDGRDITLTGEVASEEIRLRAGQQANNVYGVRSVDNLLTIAATAIEPVIETQQPEPEPETISEPVEAVIEEPKPEYTCQQNFNTLLDANQIRFATNSADIDVSSNSLLIDLIDVAKQCPDANIEIGGHTDSRGSDEYNQQLSQLRATSVMEYLVENGVDATRLSAVGYGEYNPIADNETAEGLAKNRRIEFNVKGL